VSFFKKVILSLLFFSFYKLSAQVTSADFENFLKTNLPRYKFLLENKQKYRLQIVYVRIDRDENNVPHFIQYDFNNDPNLFYYCASTVKLPASMLALEKIKALNVTGLNRQSPMLTDSAFYCQHRVIKDTSSENGMPSIEQYIKKMLLVSDNYAFSRVYEFLTCDYLQAQLSEKGFPTIRMVNKLDAACPGDTSKIAPPIYFLNKKGDTIYKQPLIREVRFNSPTPIPNARVGHDHHNNADKKVPGPKDFSRHNYISLQNQIDILKALIFMPYNGSAWKIDNSDRLFLIKQMGMYPRESNWPRYNPIQYYDSYKKYLMYGAMVPKITNDSIRIFNIVGQAYGFLTDCAYITDSKNKVEFMLAATIYVNESEDVGSGNYQTNKTGLPFFRDLGKTIYQSELKREKQFPPDLSEFNLYK